MAKESKINWLAIILTLFVIISIMLTVKIYFLISEKPIVEEIEKEYSGAVLDIKTLFLAENIEDSSEMFYDYTIFNYGEGEAKDIVVNCKTWDMDDKLVFSLRERFGNLASKSYQIGEIVGENKINLNEDYTSLCYVESCDNCKILWKEIPELVELYN